MSDEQLKHNVLRRRLLKGAGGIAAMAFANPAFSQEYPSKPIRMVVPISPGGSTDRLARSIASALAEDWQSPVVVENKPGASGMIAADQVARSPADGYTALIAQVSLVQLPSLVEKLPYDFARDFAPVTLIGTVPVMLVVRSDSPFRTLQDYLDAARTRATPVSFGSFGNGSSFHIYGATLARDAKVSLLHVPYKGEGPALIDVLGGQLDSSFCSVSSAKPLIASGRIRALAVVGRKTAAMPDVPSLVDLGFPRLDVRGWIGVSLPAGVRPKIVEKLSAGLRKVARRPDIAKTFADMGGDLLATTPKEFETFLNAEYLKWKDLIKSTGIKRVL